MKAAGFNAVERCDHLVPEKFFRRADAFGFAVMDAKNAVKDTDDFNEEKPYYKLNENIRNVDEDKAGKILEHLEK